MGSGLLESAEALSVAASITCRAYASITRRVVTVCSIWSCPNGHAVSNNYLYTIQKKKHKTKKTEKQKTNIG